MDKFEPLGIDERRFGEWVASDGWVVSVAGLVVLEKFWNREPHKPAARAVLDLIEATPGVRAYITCRNDHARPVTATSGWSGSALRGLPGLLRLARRKWIDHLAGDFDQFSASIQKGQFAIHLEDAERLYGDRFDWLAKQSNSEGSADATEAGFEATQKTNTDKYLAAAEKYRERKALGIKGAADLTAREFNATSARQLLKWVAKADEYKNANLKSVAFQSGASSLVAGAGQ